MFLQGGARADEQKDGFQEDTHVAQRYIENPYLINGNELNQISPFSLNLILEKRSNTYKKYL